MKTVAGSFEIPEEIAKRLSELLAKQSIRERVLAELVDDSAKYDAFEAKLIPVIQEIDALKIKITREYVPDKFNSDRFEWNYDGYDVAGTTVNIYADEP